MAKGIGLKRVAEGGVGIVVASGVVQAIMDRSGTDAATVARNGAIAGVGSTVLGVLGAWLGRKSPLVSTLGIGVGAAGISGLTAIGTQLVDEKLRAKSAAASQNAIDQVGQATGAGNQPNAPDAPAPRAARAAYVDDSGFDSSI